MPALGPASPGWRGPGDSHALVEGLCWSCSTSRSLRTWKIHLSFVFLPTPSWIRVEALSAGKDGHLGAAPAASPPHEAQALATACSENPRPEMAWGLHFRMASSPSFVTAAQETHIVKATCPRSHSMEVPGQSLSLGQEDVPILRRKDEGFGSLQSAFHRCPFHRCPSSDDRRVTLQPYRATACPPPSQG